MPKLTNFIKTRNTSKMTGLKGSLEEDKQTISRFKNGKFGILSSDKSQKKRKNQFWWPIDRANYQLKEINDNQWHINYQICFFFYFNKKYIAVQVHKSHIERLEFVKNFNISKEIDANPEESQTKIKN